MKKVSILEICFQEVFSQNCPENFRCFTNFLQFLVLQVLKQIKLVEKVFMIYSISSSLHEHVKPESHLCQWVIMTLMTGKHDEHCN